VKGENPGCEYAWEKRTRESRAAEMEKRYEKRKNTAVKAKKANPGNQKNKGRERLHNRMPRDHPISTNTKGDINARASGSPRGEGEVPRVFEV